MTTRKEIIRIKGGSEIELTLQESIVGVKLLPPRFKKKIREFLTDLKKRVAEPFFMWVCEYCETMGYVGYEEGDDNQVILGHIYEAHRGKAKRGCDGKSHFRIFNHKGEELKEFTRIMSFKEVN